MFGDLLECYRDLLVHQHLRLKTYTRLWLKGLILESLGHGYSWNSSNFHKKGLMDVPNLLDPNFFVSKTYIPNWISMISFLQKSIFGGGGGGVNLWIKA